ncbi:hypothetical protein FOQG_04047 [Fusarium oxysporum f. sp. raphani 54005]|uniref:Uncharacterized protein n=2 Tax=Fusarium oxysporum TaxID=5507 RepID=X0CX82_FUSOX|nr:hypothetical protein FOVG_10309 [Fusarium oxysporum f. sp. pisi HDV247]EXK95479.1 hypothetical protein FOQG_04047 [Fusarium oxysporum f. sp. raphani 54005]
MSDNPQDIPAMTDSIEQEFAYGRRKWTSADPVALPHEPVYRFFDSALKAGHFREDVPGNATSAKRKKDADGYLMVKRDGNKAGFLWCDADGKAVDKKYIQMAEGIIIKHLRGPGGDAIIITMARRRIVKFSALGTAEPPFINNPNQLRQFINEWEKREPFFIDDEDRHEQYMKERVFCSETDPELN